MSMNVIKGALLSAASVVAVIYVIRMVNVSPVNSILDKAFKG